MNEEQKQLSEKIENVENALKQALEENGLTMATEIDFPKYRELPTEVQLALEVLKSHGGSIVRQYSVKKEETKE